MTAASSSELTGRLIHVWSVRTEAPDAVTGEFQRVLSADEAARAARFHFDHLQHSYILARGALRILLGHYLNCSPAAISFRYDAKGKPSLAAASRIRFNLSHSGTIAVLAFALDRELGIDVERIRPMPDFEDVARRFFCEEEVAELMSLPASERGLSFFLCWTRKEAYIKAIGQGLSTPLDSFQVTLKPAEPARFIHIAHDRKESEAWSLHDLKLADAYAAALAYRDAPCTVRILPYAEPAELLAASFIL